MKNLYLIFVCCLLFCACGAPDPGFKSKAAKDGNVSVAPEVPASKIIARIETATYKIIFHDIIKFDNAGGKAFVPKKGFHYLLFDVSVENKTKKPIDMSLILSNFRIKNKGGSEFGDLLGAITAYDLANPDKEISKAYSTIWSDAMEAGKVYRGVALGCQAPKVEKQFEISLPESDDIMKLSKKVMGKISID